MKTEKSKMARAELNRSNWTGWWLLVLLLTASGCSRLPRQHERLNAELAEESRALTTAVVDALNLQPGERRDEFTESALRLARQDQRIEGLPLQPFDLPVLLAQSNAIAPAPSADQTTAAWRDLEQRFAAQNELLEREGVTSGALLQKGLETVREQNRVRVAWTKRLLALGLPFAGLVALCVFFPAAIPLVGRVLAWLVAKIPALSSAAGVVSVQAFDAVVRGLERAKAASNGPSGMANRAGAPGAPSLNPAWVDLLQERLGREMDASHKELVRYRKRVLGQR